MLRCVLDTNVLISAALTPHGTPRRVAEWVIGSGQLIGSDATLSEFNNRFVPRAKFDRYLSIEARIAFFDRVAAACEMVAPTSRLAVCRDPDDDRFAELATDGVADVLVTGNTRDFPDTVGNAPVLTPAAFAALHIAP